MNPKPKEKEMGTNPATAANERPRISMVCLTAYNNGVLHGAWIDADQEA
ncbi:MAG TPA: hypothetical protein VF226_15820 [Hyphomicrobiaceae bacterium]